MALSFLAGTYSGKPVPDGDNETGGKHPNDAKC
jgi:hypothetical protein